MSEMLEASMDRGSWTFGIGLNMYLWPGGKFVLVFGYVEYVRRLSGEIRDAQPFKTCEVGSFASVENFRAWCARDYQEQEKAALPDTSHVAPLRLLGGG
ncbi:hypothetical protein [Saccharopolyspora sp. NPDC002686]|uniref:hypothetical protein n=1 Tax=Saccharopolyspora sp. NPDC002686 TaxID=3154541 RepID=UPI00331AB3CB